MTAPSQVEISEDNKAVTQIQRLAWIIVMVSFALFCSFSVAITGGVYYFLFRSAVPMTSYVQVARGTAGVVSVNNQSFPRSGPTLTFLSDRPATVSTDSLSQAVMTFETSTDEGTNVILGTLTLKNDSSVTLDAARHPRFAWSDGRHTVDLTNFDGRAELYITQIPDRPLRMRIATELGNSTFVFDTVGRYSISADESLIRVTTLKGRALLVPPQSSNGRFAVEGERATLLTGSVLPAVTTAPVNLLENGLFAFDITTSPESSQPQIPQQWGCFNPSEDQPNGEWRAGTWNGRQAVQLIRESGTSTSRTGCSHWLDVPVTDYSYLELRATMSLNFQSLVNCGFVGSECPMMIFMEYLDANNDAHVWYQSFFYNFDPQNPAPLVCQECALAFEHRPIADNVWYTYESGNLMSRLPEEIRPTRILEVRFYASGHQYNVALSELSLFAGTEQVTEVPIEGLQDTD